MNSKSFVSRTVFYCSKCQAYKITELDCGHEFMLVLFSLSNGSEQLRQMCTKCFYRQPKALKQGEHNLTNVLRKTELSYQDYYSKQTIGESTDIRKFIEPFKEKQKTDFCRIYTDYIGSDEWKGKREKILRRDLGKCQICGKEAEQVHHLTYVHLKNEYTFELVSLCKECHKNEYHSGQITEHSNNFKDDYNPNQQFEPRNGDEPF
ncbi:MAG: hypothetical protein WC319_03820 [Candidatus Paceibacterota bacterium]